MNKNIPIRITGQDGAYLAEFLLEKGYEVHGIKRRTSLFNTDKLADFNKNFYPDMTDLVVFLM